MARKILPWKKSFLHLQLVFHDCLLVTIEKRNAVAIPADFLTGSRTERHTSWITYQPEMAIKEKHNNYVCTMKERTSSTVATLSAYSTGTKNLQRCIVWGFPLTIAFIISSLVSLEISNILGGGIFVQVTSLISIFMLIALTYASLFVYLPLTIYQYLATKSSDNSMKMPNSDMETAVTSTNEQKHSYETQCMKKLRSNAENRDKVCQIIMEYAEHVMPPFLTKEDFASVCSDIRLWTMDSSHEPKAVKVCESLTSLDIRHFIWNIAERMSRSMNLPKSKNYEYDGESRIRFMTAMFPDLFKDISHNTLKNFTHKPDFGQIKLDRLNRSDLYFHYEKGIGYECSIKQEKHEKHE